MAGADAGIVAGLSASIAEVKGCAMQANQVVEDMKIEFRNMLQQLDQKQDSQGLTLGATDIVLQSDITNIRTTVEASTQSYDPTTPAKIIELYEQAKDQHLKTEATQQAANTLYVQLILPIVRSFIIFCAYQNNL